MKIENKVCGDCRYVSPSEKTQNEYYSIHKKKLEHICRFYNLQLKHNGLHPALIRLRRCMNNQTKERI